MAAMRFAPIFGSRFSTQSHLGAEPAGWARNTFSKVCSNWQLIVCGCLSQYRVPGLYHV